MAGSRTLKLSILADVDDLKKKLDTGANEVEGFGGKLEKFGKVAAAAFAAAAAAAAAYAGKLAIDGVKAAIEDEAAQKRLASALEATTGATEAQVKQIEAQILKTSLATGVADDKLRPALQRLALATGDVDKSQQLLNLALDISAGTGKDVETVSNALAKAYEGNNTSLARLGVGLSAAELKSMTFKEATQALADTFGGSAQEQANTFEGQINRLKVAFDEAKESVGSALLPILKDFLDYWTNNLQPKLIAAKEKAIDPIIQAFKDNEDTLRDLWKFIKDYVVPIFETTLVLAIQNAGKTIAGIVTVVAKVFEGIRTIVDNAIDGINAFLKLYNSIPILPNVGLISKPSWVTGTQTGPLGNYSMSTGQTISSGSKTVSSSSSSSSSSSITSTPKVTDITGLLPEFPLGGKTTDFTSVLGSTFNPSAVRAGESKGDVIINVNSASVIDEEGFTRAVIMALNNSQSRSGGGAAQLML